MSELSWQSDADQYLKKVRNGRTDTEGVLCPPEKGIVGHSDRIIEMTIHPPERFPQPGTRARAVARYRHAQSHLVWSAATYEGLNVTLPQVETLIEGVTPAGMKLLDANIINDLTDAHKWLVHQVETGQFSLTIDSAREINAMVARHESIAPGTMRGDENAPGGGGYVSVVGKLRYTAPQAQVEQTYAAVLDRASEYEHPAHAAAYLMSCLPLVQGFFDGNKRTTRMLASGLLLSQGYDGIFLPASKRTEYSEALAQVFSTYDATALTELIYSCQIAANEN